MPRYKRRSRHYYKKRNYHEQNGSQYDNHSGGALSPADRAMLLKYLLDYKDGCERICFPGDFCPSDEETVVTAPAATNKSQDDGTFVEIGGSRFPALTEKVLGLPYLELPRTLSSKQRRAIHELCVDGKMM